MGREFIPLFEDWAATYDQTVQGLDIQYKEAFRGYDHILDAIVRKSGTHVLEFGPGTGNLTAKLLDAGKTVFGINLLQQCVNWLLTSSQAGRKSLMETS